MTVEVTPAGTRGGKWSTGRGYQVIMGLIAGLYRTLGGRGMGRTGILTTVGARSGQKREAQLAIFPEGDGWLVVGSKGGSATHPAWVVNMARNPDKVWLQVGKRNLHVKPKSLDDAARAVAWKRIVSDAPNFAGYEKKTDRKLPVIRLTPTD